VLENRTTGETLLLGSITNNGLGTINLPDSVTWTNIFDAGPRVDIEYVYDPVRGLEQNLLLRESPGLPSGWSLADTILECWTEWWLDAGPAAVESRAIILRPQSGTNSTVQAEDATISFGASRITAGGKAFSTPGDSASLPVAKSWIQTTPQSPQESTRRFLIESLDFLSARSKFAALPKSTRQASATQPKSGRSDLLRLHAKIVGDDVRRLIIKNGLPSKTLLIARTASPNHQLPVASNSDGDGSTINYQLSQSPSLTLDFTLQNAVPVPSGAISWWPAGGDALDALTNHNNGTPYNSPTYAAGEVGQAFSLSGPTEDNGGSHFRVSDSRSLHVTNAVTVEAWVNPATVDYRGFGDIVDKWDLVANVNQMCYDLSLAPDGTAYIIVSANGQPSGASYVITTNVVPFDTWTHVAGVYDGSALRVYLNGDLKVAGSYTNGLYPGTNDLGIGGLVGGGNPGDVGSALQGLLDEPAIYARALSASEIQAIYNAGPAGKINPNCVQPLTNAVGWWPGDGNACDIAHTNMGTLRNGATFASGVVGQAFSFDGVDDYVRIENNWDLNPQTAITIEAWVWMDHYDYNHAIIRKDAECSNRQYMLAASISGKFRAHIGLTNGNYYYVDSTTSVEAQTWYHLAEVYDQTNLSIYLNGVLEASAPLSGAIVQTTEPVFIGGSVGYCWDYNFPGLIDEASIYSRALSGTEISAIYSAGCAGKCKNYVSGDLFTDLQNLFLGLTSSDADSDSVPNGTEFFQGRNPKIAGTVADTNNLINLQVYTPLK